MAAYVRGHEHASLGHRFEWLQRRDDLCEPHAVPRIGKDVDELVVLLHVGMRNAPHEYHPIGESARERERPQCLFLGTAADEQHTKIRPTRGQQGDGLDEKIEPFVRVEGAGEADHGLALESEPVPKCRVGLCTEAELTRVDRIRNDGDAVEGNPARSDLVAQALADGRDVVRTAQRERFECTGRAVPNAALRRRAVICRRIFPKRANLVHHGNPQAASDPQRRQRIQYRRMRVQDVRAKRCRQFGDSARSGSHLLNVDCARHTGQRASPHAACDESANHRLPPRPPRSPRAAAS